MNLAPISRRSFWNLSGSRHKLDLGTKKLWRSTFAAVTLKIFCRCTNA
jgi:hypothetical protein